MSVVGLAHLPTQDQVATLGFAEQFSGFLEAAMWQLSLTAW